MDKLQEIERKRAELRAKRDNAANEQLAKDLEAIYAHELNGPVGIVKMAFVEGSVVRAAVRPANPDETKRYRARIKLSREGKIDPQAAHAAAVELGLACQLYPEPKSEANDRMRQDHPNVDQALGLMALKLAGAEEEEAGKD